MNVQGEKSGSKTVSDEDKKRFEDLFNSLDTNKDGTVDIQELTAALKGRKEPSRQAAVPIDYSARYRMALYPQRTVPSPRPLSTSLPSAHNLTLFPNPKPNPNPKSYPNLKFFND